MPATEDDLLPEAPLTVWGLPVKFDATLQPGTYEIRYLDEE